MEEDLLQEYIYSNIISPPLCMKVSSGAISMDCILSFHSLFFLKKIGGKRRSGIGN